MNSSSPRILEDKEGPVLCELIGCPAYQNDHIPKARIKDGVAVNGNREPRNMRKGQRENRTAAGATVLKQRGLQVFN
ncbi:hypothetical protein RRG08_034430 [Elysia crispata]|uniref:Uncharacterized protein n=1 Tax=Elysia crispata TaxID=231223 RepID=A0AAE0YD65_9GAST|nr:hypothetical protein RRG08_034430 [Elysia crispata]